jgi:RES domain
MTVRLPAQDLDCPDPNGCPVPSRLPALTLTTVAASTLLFRVYDSTWRYDEFNPGFGDARFSPFDASGAGHRVPSMYVAATQTAALLETVFHDVHQHGGRTIYERDLRGKLLAHVRLPVDAVLADLRDPQLDRLQLARGEIVTSPAEHYPCTRRLAAAAHSQPTLTVPAQGLIWHSRQAELSRLPPAEVVVLFGDRYPSGRGTWIRSGPGSSTLYEGPGRLLVDRVAEQLAATVQPED